MTETHDISSLPRPPRRAWRPLVLGLILLTSGAAIGAGSALYVIEQRIVNLAEETPERVSDRATKDMRSRWDLSLEQSERLKEIFHARHVAMKAIREEVRPRLEEELEAMRTDVLAVLTPEQAAQWNEKFERLRKRWVHGGRGGPRRDKPEGRPRIDGPPPESSTPPN